MSLSAGENVLPSTSATGMGSDNQKGKGRPGTGMAKMVFGRVKSLLGSTGETLGISREGRGHARFE